MMIRIPEPTEFEWDDGNKDKNWISHQVSTTEVEEVFFDIHRRLAKDVVHATEDESRSILLGKTRKGRLLFVVFTIRGKYVWVISVVSVHPPPQSSPKGGGSKPPLPLGEGWGEGGGSDQLREMLTKRNGRYMKTENNIPLFNNEDEERDFWSTTDLTDYFEPADFESASFPNLKPTSRSISIRFPEYVLDAVKEHANKIGVPYQSLIKEAVINRYLAPE